MNSPLNQFLKEVKSHYVKIHKKKGRSEFTDILNSRTDKAIRWCTPSVLKLPQIKDPYISDISISYESLGFPSEPSGVFKVMYDRAAQVYGADHTLFSVNGTTGSNFIVLRALSKQIPNLRILAQRNVHKSVVAAFEDYGIDLMFLAPKVDPDLQLFLPNTEQEILEGLERTKPQVLLITNPTYEGIVLDLKTIITTIRSQYPNIIIFVEEAWGSHLHFSDKLPIAAMDAGADICVQSTHKQGGSLQQGGMIHWKNGRINSELLMDSYRRLSTTSPSYFLLASLDGARAIMEKEGGEKIDHILLIAKILTYQLSQIKGLEVITTKKLQLTNPSIFGRDETKIIIDVTKTGYTGFELARILEDNFNIIVEKYNATTLLLLVPFQSKIDHIHVTINAFKYILKNKKDKSAINNLPALVFPVNKPKMLELGKERAKNQVEQILLKNALGRISAETITPYPPGIPTTLEGERFTPEAISFYENIRFYPNSHLLAHDMTLETVLVIK